MTSSWLSQDRNQTVGTGANGDSPVHVPERANFVATVVKQRLYNFFLTSIQYNTIKYNSLFTHVAQLEIARSQ